MKRMIVDWLLALGVAAGVIFAAWFYDRAQTPRGTAPVLALPSMEGPTIDLASMRGRTVVVNFWGTWCPPCRAEIPEIAAWSTAHPDVPVLGVAVNSGDGDDLRKSAPRLGVNYPVLVSDGDTPSRWGVDVFPTTFVVRADGQVGAVQHGRLGEGDLDRLVAEAGG